MGDLFPPGSTKKTATVSPQQPLATDLHGDHRWVWFITGPTACGKTTIAEALAHNLGFAMVEGDDYHDQTSLDKMSQGRPLTDADRHVWLLALRDHVTAQPQTSPQQSRHQVITCSALKRRYRDVLRRSAQDAGNLRVRFVFLDVDEHVLRERAAQRKGHFAGEELVASQMEALEHPGEEDEADVIVVRVEGDRPVDETVRAVEVRVREEMGSDDGSF
ncbi:putative gluconokinase [Madurella mycetomatis]|uniref:Gluconokinase n=1 Tax=Madurella mycetomatis TaxID=100816 RepID=A0A175W803_9PEZI|nr:putative gluconokinase [Madurella mycetomatis]KXX79639.1 putative gluconokinase [Madurella mycetomatis]